MLYPFFFAGFEACDFAPIELSFALVPFALGIGIYAISRNYPRSINANYLAFIFTVATVFAPLVLVEIALFNADNYLSSGQFQKINSWLLLGAPFFMLCVFLIARKSLHLQSSENLMRIRTIAYKVISISFALTGIAFLFASSCLQSKF